jgi:molybdenum cofactor cytidylyltransferase/nicotine blue oxidoreductase
MSAPRRGRRDALAGAVLAAGSGTRMGTPKAELVVGGCRLVDRAVSALREGGCAPVFAIVRPATHVSGAEAVVNAEPERGMRSSLELAVSAAADAAAAGLAVTLVDTPHVDAQVVTTVLAAWTPGSIVRARHRDGCSGDGVPGHPIVMSVPAWQEALTIAGADEGARAYLAAKAELVHDVWVEGPAWAAWDLDTPDDLRRWHHVRP